ncbi:MAG: hypothetical protein ABMA02_08815 [Saprospiraceae bacterium]
MKILAKCSLIILLICLFNTAEAQIGTGKWTRKADFSGQPRYNAVSFSINGKAYVGLGSSTTEGTQPYMDFREYNPATNTWTKKADCACGSLTGATAFSVGGKGYLAGGNSHRKLFEYNPATNTWAEKALMPNVPQGGRLSVGFAINGKGYVVETALTKQVFEYNPATNTWVVKPNQFPGTGRHSATGMAIGNKGYLGTGVEDDFNPDPLNDWWEYNPATDTWTQKADYGGGKIGGAMSFSVNGKGYVVMGKSKEQNNSDGHKNETWEYNPATNMWIKKATAPGDYRKNGIGLSIGTKGYIGLGEYNYEQAHKDFYEFDPAVLPLKTN